MHLVKMTASMSSFITNGKYWTTDCIRHPKRRLCVCCPNGVHIDVDFDAFYKTLTKMQKSTPPSNTEDPNKPYKVFKRKQDPTIDALLGYRTQPSVNVDEIVYKSRDAPAKASPDVQESLEQALHDFEETLIRSSTSDARSPIMSPLLNNHFSSSLSIRSDSKSDCLQQLVNGDKHEDQESIKTTPEFRSTPVDFKTIITEFRRSPTDFMSSLTDFRSTSIDSKRKSTSSDSTIPSLETKISFQKTFKDVGVNCTVITRDIGTTHIPKIYHSISTNTDENRRDSPTFSRFSLQQILQQPKYTTVSTQTISKITPLEIVEKRDYGVQTEIEKPILLECKLKSIFESSKHRSVATSTELSPRQECLPPILDHKRMYSKFSQTKDVVVRDRVLLKKVGCQTDFRIPHYRDVAINTIRQKMVNASVGESTVQKVLCERCNDSKINSSSTPQSVSKIPRPKNIPVNANSNRKKLLMRQDTYVTTPTTELENLKLLQIQETSKIRELSDEPKDAVLPIVNNSTELNSEKSYFQPILESKPKAEPSKEMKAAMKVFNDSMKKSSFSQLKETSLKNAINIIQQEWFKVSSLSSADPLTVEDYLDAFEEVSTSLLEYIVNMRDGAGNTAMHYAVSHGNFDVVSILLDSKVCDINIINDAGYTCVMLVSLAQIKSDTHQDVIRRLFSMADVNLKAKQHGQTTLMLAASHGKVDVVRLLIESGADVNIQDDDGSTALMCAAEHGYLDIVNTLAVHPDCDLTIKDNDGSTALTIAMEAGHREIGIALYTRQHFADLNQASAKEKRSRSANPILMEHRARTPSLKSAPSSPSPLT